MDIATTLILSIMFALPTVFMTTGFSFKKAKAVACLISAAVLWMVLVPVFPIVSNLAYPFLGYVFFIPAFVCFLFALPPSISMWKERQKEGWEEDEED